MMSGTSRQCLGVPTPLKWFCFDHLLLLLFLIPFVVAKAEEFTINYGNDLGEATVAFHKGNHTASITPANATQPSTLVDFKKGIAIYIAAAECMVSKIPSNEHDYVHQLAKGVHHVAKQTLYVTGPISKHKATRLLRPEISKWCFDRPILWLSTRRPKLPAKVFSLKSGSSSSIGLDSRRGSRRLAGTLDEEEEKEVTPWSEHQRYKRRTREEKKKGRKNKSSKKRGKDRKQKKNRKNKKPNTKSLGSGVQQLNIKAPRISFPAVFVPPNLTDEAVSIEGSSDHVVLQEEPYLSPSFMRIGDDGQRFKHYRDFYQEPFRNNDTHSTGHVSRIISHDPTDPSDGETRISIPETIVKDGQIFYRHDADVSTTDATRGQTKRSHTEGVFSDDKARLEDQFEYHNDSGDFPYDYISHDDSYTRPDHSLTIEHGFSHVHTQAQMGEGMRGASAGALTDLGSGAHVQGSSDSDGFFIAQAHSNSHPNDEKTSSAHVFGNMHGVVGSATSGGREHQSHVQVDMGAHPSATAHIAMHGGSTLLSSRVHATQVGGRAGAQAHGDGASSSNAHMEFNPSFQHEETSSGLHGQGLASATITDSGGSLLTSLSGKVSGGSYLGTAHSSISADPALPYSSENITWGTHDAVTHEFGQPVPVIEEPVEGAYHQENVTHGRQGFHELPYHTEQFGEISSHSRHSSSLQTEHQVDQGFPDGHMISNIMETVHQPDMTPDVFSYPVRGSGVIDEEGLTGGAGIPPRESEIEQTPISAHEIHREGLSEGGSKAGIVGLATYSHGQLGAPPGPGELLNYRQEESPQFDYDYYDDTLSRKHYEYDDRMPQDPYRLPFFDLGPEINGFVPLESNFENFEPMQFGIPHQPTDKPQEAYDDVVNDSLSAFHRQDEHDSYDITPDPPITVYQVQASTILPGDISASGQPVSPSLSQEPPSLNFTGSLEERHDQREFVETSTSLPAHAPPDFSATTQVPRVEPLFTAPSRQTFEVRPIHQNFREVPLEQSTTFVSSSSQNTTHLPTVSQGQSQIHSSVPSREDSSRTIELTSQRIQPQVTSGMMGIPLDPGNPGSVQYFPGDQETPDLKIMSVSATEARQSHSLLSQRMRASLQPGQNIPGAPGYKVPPGFRGHVILGDNLPANAESRRVVQGFNTHVSLAPQYPASEHQVYASVSGPGASSQLRSQEDATGVHITLGGSAPASGRTGTAGISSSQHTSMLSSMQSYSRPGSTVMTSSQMRQSSLPPRKSWDGRRHDMTAGSGKSWGATGRSGDECGYYSMRCNTVYGPNGDSQICKPILITIGCCC